MNTVIKFPVGVAPISKPISRGSNVSTNRRSGYVICWRSLMAADWAKSAVKFAGWMRIISLAAYEESAVSYKGREWTLMRGQLVISTTELGTLLRDERGRAVEHAVVGVDPVGRDGALLAEHGVGEPHFARPTGLHRPVIAADLLHGERAALGRRRGDLRDVHAHHAGITGTESCGQSQVVRRDAAHGTLCGFSSY